MSDMLSIFINLIMTLNLTDEKCECKMGKFNFYYYAEPSVAKVFQMWCQMLCKGSTLSNDLK